MSPRVTDEAIFAALTAPSADDDCVLWTGRKDEKGYGRIGYKGRSNQRAHRVAWQMHRGPIPEGMCVLHRCDTPSCVNVNHLFLGTQADNNRDRHAKGRTRGFPGTRNRAKLTVEQIQEARALRAKGVSQQDIADLFKVSRGHIARIVKGALPGNARRERGVI